jgi:hypothetical protein
VVELLNDLLDSLAAVVREFFRCLEPLGVDRVYEREESSHDGAQPYFYAV